MRSRSLAGVLILLGALTLAACGPTATAAGPTPGAQTITVIITDTGLTASQTAIRLGVPCHFVVTNAGTVPHEFWLMPREMAPLMGQMPMAQWHQHLLYGTQDIAPGQTVAFAYTMPMMGQPLAFGGYAAGEPLMELPIVVGP